MLRTLGSHDQARRHPGEPCRQVDHALPLGQRLGRDRGQHGRHGRRSDDHRRRAVCEGAGARRARSGGLPRGRGPRGPGRFTPPGRARATSSAAARQPLPAGGPAPAARRDRSGTGTPRYRHTNSCLGLYKRGCHAFARSRGIWEEYLNRYGALPHIVRDVAAAFRGGRAPRGRGPRDRRPARRGPERPGRATGSGDDRSPGIRHG